MYSNDLRRLSMYGGDLDRLLDRTRSYLGDRDRDLDLDLNLRGPSLLASLRSLGGDLYFRLSS